MVIKGDEANLMLLPFTDGLIRTTHFDQECRMLADRHYSRRTVGARQFTYSGRKLVLRDAQGLVLFVWMWPDESMRMDHQKGFNCSIFRNESNRRSSEIILEAEQMAFQYERTLKELGDKVDKSKLEGIEKDIEGLKELLKDKEGNYETIKSAKDALTQKFQKVSEELYKHASEEYQKEHPQQGAGEAHSHGEDDGHNHEGHDHADSGHSHKKKGEKVVDADFKEKK